MIKRNIKKMLSEELEHLAPSLSEEARSYPLPRQTEPSEPVRRPFFFRRLAAIAIAAVLVLTLAAPALYFGTVRHPSVVVLEINPVVALSTDPMDRVTAAVSRNRDGDLLLADPQFADALIGKTSAEAAVLLASRAVELGYFEETGGAVRVSAANEIGFRADRLRKQVSESLTEYFCEQGIWAAVLSRKVSISDLTGVGLTGQSVEQIAQALTSSPVRVQDLENQQVTEETLDVSYVARLQQYALEVVANVGQTMKNKKIDLAELHSLSEQIKAHEENPGYLFGLLAQDYWELLTAGELGDGISALMQKMTALLENYRLNYDQEIDSGNTLFLLYHFYDILDLDELQSLFEDLINGISDLAFDLQLDLLLSFLNEDGSLAAWIDGLFSGLEQPPQSVEEYEEQTQQMLLREAEMRAEAAAEFNRQSREPISRTQYQEYLDSLGDLDAYWETLERAS